LHALHIEDRHCPAAIRWCERDANIRNRVLQRNIAVGDVQHVAVIWLEIRNEQVAARSGLADLLMTCEGADALDTGNANQREALLDLDVWQTRHRQCRRWRPSR
jgi:hypothetical protein